MVIDGKKQQQRKHSNVEFLNLFSPSILIPLHKILQNKKSLACPTFIFTTSFFLLSFNYDYDFINIYECGYDDDGDDKINESFNNFSWTISSSSKSLLTVID